MVAVFGAVRLRPGGTVIGRSCRMRHVRSCSPMPSWWRSRRGIRLASLAAARRSRWSTRGSPAPCLALRRAHRAGRGRLAGGM